MKVRHGRKVAVLYVHVGEDGPSVGPDQTNLTVSLPVAALLARMEDTAERQPTTVIGVSVSPPGTGLTVRPGSTLVFYPQTLETVTRRPSDTIMTDLKRNVWHSTLLVVVAMLTTF